MSDLREAAEMALESWGFFFSQAHPEIVGLMYGNDWAKIAKERTEALRQALAQPDEVLAEREACAKVCDDFAAQDKLSNYYAVAAKAIRARGER